MPECLQLFLLLLYLERYGEAISYLVFFFCWVCYLMEWVSLYVPVHEVSRENLEIIEENSNCECDTFFITQIYYEAIFL